MSAGGKERDGKGKTREALPDIIGRGNGVSGSCEAL